MKKYRSYFIDLLFIIAGCAATALGITMFLSPNRISSGGVSSIEDVERLAALEIYGAIIGKAYYTKAIDLKKAIEVAK